MPITQSHKPQGPKVPLAAAEDVIVRPTRQASEDEVRGHARVAAVREGFFNGRERQVEDVGEEMEAEEESWEIGGQERAEEVGGGMVVGRCEGEGCRYVVVPIPVEAGERLCVSRLVKNVAVENICQDLAQEVALG